MGSRLAAHIRGSYLRTLLWEALTLRGPFAGEFSVMPTGKIMRDLFSWFILVVLSIVAVPSGQAQVGSLLSDYDFKKYHPAECSTVLQTCRTYLSYQSHALPSRSSAVAWRSDVQDETGRVHTGWLIAGGVAGTLAAAGLGALAATACSEDDWCFGPIILGTGAEIVGVPLGVHLANGGKGNYLLDALASAGVFALGVLLLNSDDSLSFDRGNVGQALFVLVPAAQIGVSIALERQRE